MKGTDKCSGDLFGDSSGPAGNRLGQSESRQQRTVTFNRNNQWKLYERPESTAARGYVNEASTVHVHSNSATN